VRGPFESSWVVSELCFVGKLNSKVSKAGEMLPSVLFEILESSDSIHFSIEAVWVSLLDIRALTAPIGSPLVKTSFYSFFAVLAHMLSFL
jgi:hypothetical protein